MDPTRFTRTYIRTALNQMGIGATEVQDADSLAAAEAVVEEEGILGGADFRAVAGAAEGGTRIKGINNQRNRRVIIFKAATKIKATIMKIIIMVKLAEATSGHPQEMVRIPGTPTRPLAVGYKRSRGIILNSLGGSIGRVLQGI